MPAAASTTSSAGTSATKNAGIEVSADRMRLAQVIRAPTRLAERTV